MATVEIKDDIFEEIKTLAEDFLSEDSPKQNVTIDSDVATIGLRMVEVLFPEEYKKYFWRLMDAVKEELKKRAKQ